MSSSNEPIFDPRRSELQKPLGACASSAAKEVYRQAGKSRNTHDSYLRAVNHYRDVWGGLLPASSGQITDYIVHYAKDVKVSTTRLRLAALSKWHQSQGLYDPTRSAEVREVLKGISKLHQSQAKQAYPLTFEHLKVMVACLEDQKRQAITSHDHSQILRTHRDLALLLIGFWQGFRSDELSRVTAENVVIEDARLMRIFLPYSKTDAEAQGRTYTLRAFRAYCPVHAYQGWVDLAGIEQGPVFRNINRWGQLAETGINKRSIEHILNRVAEGLFATEPRFTTHSLRRGFAAWAADQGWDIKALCEHVGWRSFETASKYMPLRQHFGALELAPGKSLLAQGHPDAAVDQTGTSLFASHAQIDQNR